MLEEVLSDYDAEVIAAVFGKRKGMFTSEYPKAKTIGEAFTELEELVDEYYTS